MDDSVAARERDIEPQKGGELRVRVPRLMSMQESSFTPQYSRGSLRRCQHHGSLSTPPFLSLNNTPAISIISSCSSLAWMSAARQCWVRSVEGRSSSMTSGSVVPVGACSGPSSLIISSSSFFSYPCFALYSGSPLKCKQKRSRLRRSMPVALCFLISAVLYLTLRLIPLLRLPRSELGSPCSSSVL